MTPGSGPARLSKRITARRRGLDGRPRGPTARRGEGEAAAACETPPLDAEPVTTQGGGAYKRLGFTCPRCAPACYGPGVPRNPRMPGLNRPFSQVNRPGEFRSDDDYYSHGNSRRHDTRIVASRVRQ